MIGVKLMGGLGNQMFQYALGRKLSLMYGTKLILDLTGYQNQAQGDTQRYFELNRFNITGELQTKPIVNKNLLTKILYRNYDFKHKYYEKQFPFDKKVLEQPEGTLFEGYWQTEKYFIDVRNQLLKDFTLSSSFSKYDNNYLVNIRSTNSVSLHVRRGDYVSNENANKFHVLQGIKYYSKALQLLSESINNFTLYVFSDDIQWCKKHLDNIHSKIVFVDGKREGVIDMMLMKNCKHNIVANSSFSWWAAWLNENSNKKVIAPKSWFKDSAIDTRDIIPDSWTKL